MNVVPGGKKANLTEIIAITMRKRLKHLNYKGEDPVRAEITLGFDGAGSYQEFGRENNPDQKNQIFGKYTVWIFQDFCITQILREINFVDSRSAKTAVFAISGDVIFVHLVNFSLQKVQKFIKAKIQSFKIS